MANAPIVATVRGSVCRTRIQGVLDRVIRIWRTHLPRRAPSPNTVNILYDIFPVTIIHPVDSADRPSEIALVNRPLQIVFHMLTLGGRARDVPCG